MKLGAGHPMGPLQVPHRLVVTGGMNVGVGGGRNTRARVDNCKLREGEERDGGEEEKTENKRVEERGEEKKEKREEKREWR
jgi:hypothetical protein